MTDFDGVVGDDAPFSEQNPLEKGARERPRHAYQRDREGRPAQTLDEAGSDDLHSRADRHEHEPEYGSQPERVGHNRGPLPGLAGCELRVADVNPSPPRWMRTSVTLNATAKRPSPAGRAPLP